MQLTDGVYPSGRVSLESGVTDIEVFAGWFMLRETHCDTGEVFRTWFYRDCGVFGSQWEVVDPPIAAVPLKLAESRYRAVLAEASPQPLLVMHVCMECSFDGEVLTAGGKITCPTCGTQNDVWLEGTAPPPTHKRKETPMVKMIAHLTHENGPCTAIVSDIDDFWHAEECQCLTVDFGANGESQQTLVPKDQLTIVSILPY